MSATSYDDKRYPYAVRAVAHPELGAIAQLLGHAPAPFETCRVLEIGGGDGVNLISMALAAPQAEFVCVDLSETAIADGRALVAETGVKNVRLEVMDLRDVPEAFGQFDYVLAHGVYAWVTGDVREAIMALLGRVLSPCGMAMINYNTLPGAHARRAIRDLLHDAVRGIDDPEAKVTAARETLTFYRGLWDRQHPFQRTMYEEAGALLTRPDGLLFHDELGAIWEPQLLSDVVATARRHGIDYLADAELALLADTLWPQDLFEEARVRTGGDPARYEQVKDFIDLRSFRHSLFCRAGGNSDRRFDAGRAKNLWVHGRFTPLAATQPGHAYRTMTSGEIVTRDPSLAAALDKVTASYPGAVALDALHLDARLVDALANLFVMGAVELTTFPFPVAAGAADRPRANRLALAELQRGAAEVTSIRHVAVDPGDGAARTLLTLLDGTRDRPQLAQELAKATGHTTPRAQRLVDGTLARFAQLGLLEA